MVDAGPQRVELGTGESEFEPLVDGQVVPLIAGSQGGYHVWVSVRAGGFRGPRLRMTITTEVVSAEAGATLGERTSELELGFDRTDDGALEFVGWPGVLDTTSCPLDGTVRLAVTLAEGTRVSTSEEKHVEVDGSAAFRLPPSCDAPP
jgi:hypothetical protein